MIAPVLFAASALQAAGACTLPTGWREIEAERPRFVIFGETHGTRESPELVGRVACALSSRGKPVLVAVELDASSNAQLQELWQTPVTGFRKRVVQELRGFAGRLDGVGSEAMLDMIERLHALSQAGRKVDILAFNGARDDAQAQRWSSLPHQAAHEAEQAENIVTAAQEKPGDAVLVLVGNAHAQKSTVEFRGLTYQPMAMHLAKSGRIISLNEIYGSGTMWNCLMKRASDAKGGTDTTSDCGNHKTGGDPGRRKTEVGLWATRQQGWNSGYDGYYWFPVVHGSAPVSAGTDPNAASAPKRK